MKKNILLLVVLIGLVLTGCKYEDGPGISFRSKRDRLANEWEIKDFKINDNDSALKELSNDSLMIIWSLTRTGSYNADIVYKDRSRTIRADYSSLYKNETVLNFYSSKFHKRFGSTGNYSFINHHNLVEFNVDLSEKYDYLPRVQRLEIQELRNEKVKLKGTDTKGEKIYIELEAYNKK
ncbi:MAG: hypothetical protein H7321_09970 [Bacteroidia bacterium]|nr:hypothetical protein [Bacteroidia bacterium]